MKKQNSAIRSECICCTSPGTNCVATLAAGTSREVGLLLHGGHGTGWSGMKVSVVMLLKTMH